LEPANVATANQNEAEEIKEVSFQLSLIKKKHDEAKKLANTKQDELDKVRKEIDQLYVQEVQAERPTQEMKSKIEMLEDSLAETSYKTGEETVTKHSYNHMLARMKKDFIAAKIASTGNDAALKNKAAILDLE
jgi:ATP-dependent Clp protease ATP-binding subunit ClpA